jgi:hypothetical protein
MYAGFVTRKLAIVCLLTALFGSTTGYIFAQASWQSTQA